MKRTRSILKCRRAKGADEQKILPRFFSLLHSGYCGLLSCLRLQPLWEQRLWLRITFIIFGYLSAVQSINHAADRFCALPLSLISSFIFLFTGHYMLGFLVKTVTDITVYSVRFTAEFPFSDIKIPAFPRLQ